MKNKTTNRFIIAALIGGILSIFLIIPLSILENDKPWTETKHDGICPLHPFPNQYVNDNFPGHYPTGDKTLCENDLEKGIITGDGQIFGGHLVCYNNIQYDTAWRCITPILYFPIFDILSQGSEEGGLVFIFGSILFIYGALIGVIILAIVNFILLLQKKRDKQGKK